jgi:segregation and condensation protein B
MSVQPEMPAAATPDGESWEQALRLAEALVFASDRPVPPARLQPVLPGGCEARAVLAALAERRAEGPVRLVEVAGGYAFRTGPDLAPVLTRVVEVPRRLPRAAMETLAIIAYHQPVTRAEIEEIRGASLAQSTLEALLDHGLIAPRGRKEVPGRPSLWATTPKFLEQFGLRALTDLPRREELVAEPGLPFERPGVAPHGAPSTPPHGAPSMPPHGGPMVLPEGGPMVLPEGGPALPPQGGPAMAAGGPLAMAPQRAPVIHAQGPPGSG